MKRIDAGQHPSLLLLPSVRGFLIQKSSALLPILLAIATFTAYQPAWKGKLVWDDAAHLTYPHLRSLEWTRPSLDRTGSDATILSGGFLHVLDRRQTLGRFDARLSSGQHPAPCFVGVVIAENTADFGSSRGRIGGGDFCVAPRSGRIGGVDFGTRNTLSGVCYFGSALAYLRFDRTRSKGAYAGALALFVIGLLAKTVIATLPAALLVVFWWKRGKLSWKHDVQVLIPFFAAGDRTAQVISLRGWSGSSSARKGRNTISPSLSDFSSPGEPSGFISVKSSGRRI